MDPERELPNKLPELFADDLNEAMKLPNAPRRLVLFFDTHEAFWGGHRDRRGDQYYARDEWFRRLLNKLDYKAGIIAVVAGRELPHWADKGVPIPISPDRINPHRVGHLAPADALHYLERAGVTDAALRQALVEYTSVVPGEVHPLYLGLAADVALAAQSGTDNLASEDFATNDVMDSKKVELVNRFRRYVDDELVYATDALAACRAFNFELFTYLGRPEQLNFPNSEPIFKRLLSFSFVWQDGRHGEGWYRIHDLIRRIFQERHDETTLRAHKALEAYYRQRAQPGDPTAIAEAIYHANHTDWERGVREWVQEFDKALLYSRYEFCRALLEVRTELVITTDFWKGFVSEREGDYYAILVRHDQALEEYKESANSYDAALSLAPNDAEVLNNKGNVLQRLGNLQGKSAQYEQARESYKQSISCYDTVLDVAPNDLHVLNNKGAVLRRLGDIQARLTQHNQAQKSYKQSISSFDAALSLAPNDAEVLNNKGNVLQRLGDLQAALSQYEQAQESYKQSISCYDAALNLVSNDVYALNNKGVVLQGLGGIQAALSQYEQAQESYKQSISCYDTVLDIAPNDVEVLNNKGVALRSLGDLQAQSAQDEEAQESYKQSINSYNAALNLAPDYVYALNNKGTALRRLGDIQAVLGQHNQSQESYKQSISSYNAALRLAPDYVNALKNKGRVLIRRGELLGSLNHPDEACDNFRRALTSFELALHVAPNDKRTRAAIARLQVRIRQCEEQASSPPDRSGAE
jgi:tetratricopeptide (TPR) repeat protein